MQKHSLECPTVLALFPSAFGIASIIFENPSLPVAVQVSTGAMNTIGEKKKNAVSIRKLENIIQKYAPDVLVLEEFEGARTRRHPRIQRLCRLMIALAENKGIPTTLISRAEIAQAFNGEAPRTRYETAVAVANRILALKRLLPAKRRSWEHDKPFLTLFNAAALAIAYYATHSR